jgi:hypothetical protein
VTATGPGNQDPLSKSSLDPIFVGVMQCMATSSLPNLKKYTLSASPFGLSFATKTVRTDIRPDLLGNSDNNFSGDNPVYFGDYTVQVSQ